MSKHWRYLTYVLRHKWFVLVAGRRRGVGLWQLLVHDLSKFRPDEWGPYAEWFYGYRGGSWHHAGNPSPLTPTGQEAQREKRRAFMQAFLLHLHRNPHHWQYYVLTPDAQDRPTQTFEMPRRYALEMLADWDGAGRAITGTWETPTWYERQGPKERLHPDTRALVERLLGIES